MVLFSKTTDSASEMVMAGYLPAAQAAGGFSALAGLSGTSYKIQAGERYFVARKQADAGGAGLSLRRHYRALRRLSGTIAPRPVSLTNGWLIADWLEGEVKNALPPLPELSALLYDLHRRPCFGWAINLLPLLESYWQSSDPLRRTLLWLRALKRLRRSKTPRPLRMAPLHMDVHAGNLVYQPGGLALIDWEYAGDGDIALELAAVSLANGIGITELACSYGERANIEPQLLSRQIARWRPWIALLMASWYEQRWWQTREQQFIRLADDAWRALKHQER